MTSIDLHMHVHVHDKNKIHNKNVVWWYYWCMELLCIQVSLCIFNFMFPVNQLSTSMLIFVIFFSSCTCLP